MKFKAMLVMVRRSSFFIHNTFYQPKCFILHHCVVARFFHVKNISWKNIQSSKQRSLSSQNWLKRHVNDIYVKRSRFDNYRARSAYKLIEIDDKFKLLKPGQVVVECGAAPGAWSQVAAERLNVNGYASTAPRGTLISVDLIHMPPLENVITLSGMDFTKSETQDKIKTLLLEKTSTHEIDVILSDMAPKATGIAELDQENMFHLIYSCLRFSFLNLVPGGTVLFKIWNGYRDSKIMEDVSKFFNHIKIVKPDACRNESKEAYILCRDFKGLEQR